MNYYLSLKANKQAGVVTRDQARDAGYSDADIDFLVRRKEWIPIRRGAYVERERHSAMSYEELHRALVHAVVRSLAVPAVVSHTSAAVMRGLPTWKLDLSDVHVTRADVHSSRRAAGVNHHGGEVRDEDIDVVDGIRVMSVERTIIDTARITPFEPAICVADAALRANPGAQATTLQRLDDMRDWPGVRNAGAVVAFADGRSESVGESRTRVLLQNTGLPIPELQPEIFDELGRLVARADFRWLPFCTIAEFDGKEKYHRYLAPGEAPGDVVWREKRREDALRRLGYEVVRIIWADFHNPREVVRRLLAAFERGRGRVLAG